MAVISGINSSTIRSYKSAWTHVRSKHLNKLNKLECFLHPNMNFSLYRSALKEHNTEILIIDYVLDALYNNLSNNNQPSFETTSDNNMNIQSINSQQFKFKPLFSCVPGYRDLSFTPFTPLNNNHTKKKVSFFAKSLGNYPIPLSYIKKRKSIIPIFFLHIKDLLFTIVGGESRTNKKNTPDSPFSEYILAVKILANFAQLPAGIVSRRLINSYKLIEPYILSKLNNEKQPFDMSSLPHEYTFCRNLFRLNYTFLDGICSSVNESDSTTDPYPSSSCSHSSSKT